MYKQSLKPLIPSVSTSPGQRAIAGMFKADLMHEPDGESQADLAGDLFQAYYQSNPKVVNKSERGINSVLVESLLRESSFNSRPTINNIAAAVSSVAWAHEALSTEDALKEAMSKQKESESKRAEAEQKMQDAQEAAAESDLETQDQKMKEVESLLQEAENLAKQAEAKARKIVDSPLGGGMIKDISNKANEKGEEVAGFMKGWGIDPSKTTNSSDIEYIVKMAKSTGRSAKRISGLLGRLKGVARKAAADAKASYSGVASEIDMTRDLRRIFPSERAKLVCGDPVMEALTLGRYINSGLLGWRPVQSHNQTGDFLCYVDESGSTMGDVFDCEMAIALAVADATKQDKRQYILTKFDTSIGDRVSSKDSWKDHLDWASYSRSGGTNFDIVLKDSIEQGKAIQKKDQPGPDILFLTDGIARLKRQSVEEFKKYQAQSGARLFMICVGFEAEKELQSICSGYVSIRPSDLKNNPDELTRKISTMISKVQ